MVSYKYIFFDLDRTLWDFEANALDTFEEMYKKHGLESICKDFDLFHQRYRRINRELWKRYRDGQIKKEILKYKRFYLTLKEFGHEDLDLAKKLGEDYVQLSANKTRLFPHTHEVLSYLREKYILYIITNGFEEVQLKKIRNCDLDKYFQKVITSEKAGVQKPHEKIFKFALEEANATKEESLMIGDDPEGDIKGAKEFGIDQVYFNPHQKEINPNATYEIESLSELKNIL